MSNIILTNPTDTELNNAFDTHVTKSIPCDGWHPFIAGAGSWMKSDICGHKKCHPRACPVDYVNNPTAVMPWLAKEPFECHTYTSSDVKEWTHVHIEVGSVEAMWDKGESLSISFAHAAVIALLAFHGVEVNFTDNN